MGQLLFTPGHIPGSRSLLWDDTNDTSPTAAGQPGALLQGLLGVQQVLSHSKDRIYYLKGLKLLAPRPLLIFSTYQLY